jgi:hypothetical protein
MVKSPKANQNLPFPVPLIAQNIDFAQLYVFWNSGRYSSVYFILIKNKSILDL